MDIDKQDKIDELLLIEDSLKLVEWFGGLEGFIDGVLACEREPNWEVYCLCLFAVEFQAEEIGLTITITEGA